MLDQCQCHFSEALAAGLNFGRGTGPNYWHAQVAKPVFPKLARTTFTPNEKVWLAGPGGYGLDMEGFTMLSATDVVWPRPSRPITTNIPQGYPTVFAQPSRLAPMVSPALLARRRILLARQQAKKILAQRRTQRRGMGR